VAVPVLKQMGSESLNYHVGRLSVDWNRERSDDDEVVNSVGCLKAGWFD